MASWIAAVFSGGDSPSQGGAPAARCEEAGSPPRGATDQERRALQAADAERRRLGGDLHDGAQQRLIALRVGISLAAELIPDHPAEASARLEQLAADVDAAIEELRGLSHGIYPPMLASSGLEDALSEIARRLPVPVSLSLRGLRRYPELVENAIYFTCREALQNAVKHAAGAHRIDVTLIDTGTRLSFEVADDGSGFRAGTPAGLGFQSMRSRIATAGGELTISATPGAGTSVRGSVPIAPVTAGQHSAPRPTPQADN